MPHEKSIRNSSSNTFQSRSLLEILQLKRPIIQGGMGNISPVELCVAVSRAGALGQIGAGTLSLEALARKIDAVQEQLGAESPYGLNLPLAVHPQLHDVVELALHKKVPVVTLAAGNPKPWIPVFKQAGSKVLVVVATLEQALKAEQAGADAVIGEGFEAAGKNSMKELTTFVLIRQLSRALSIPVVAAGGVGDGQGLLAAFALGAEGVQLGTRLIATKEATVHEHYKQALLQAQSEDTVILGRRHGFCTRLLKTAYSSKLSEAEQVGISKEKLQGALDEESHERGAMQGLLDAGHLNAGQISGVIDSIPTVEQLFRDMETEARIRFGAIGSFFRSTEH